MKEQETQKPKPIVEAPPKTSIEQRENDERDLFANQVEIGRLHE